MTFFKLSKRGGFALTATAFAALTSAPTLANAQPVVVADIAPVAALSDSLLGESGATVLLVGQGVSPHNAALRPSQARGLQNADLVIGVGPALTPGLWEQIETLAEGVKHVELMEVEGLRSLPFPDGGAHDDHGYEDHADHEDDHEDDHDHDHDDDHEEMKEASHDDHDHEEHAHDDHDDHDDHDHEEHAEDDHEHDHAHEGDTDPHMWLDPENASVWLAHLAAEFAEIDPANTALYNERAERESAAIAEVTLRVEALLAPYAGTSVINAHDDMRYFTTRFGLNTAGAVVPADGSSPGAASVVELGERMAEGDIGCLLTDPSHPSRLAEQMAADAGISVTQLAPLGLPGQTYPEILVALGEGLAACLGD